MVVFIQIKLFRLELWDTDFLTVGHKKGRMSHEQRVRDFMMQASPSTDSVSELFHNAIAELETLREAVTLEADLEKPNQDREKLQQYVQSRALVIDRETAKCALIFGSSGNAIDIESVQHVLEGVYVREDCTIHSSNITYDRYFSF